MAGKLKKENTIISVYGRKGSGKSFLVKEILTEYPRIVILDTLGEYDDAEIETTLAGAIRKILSVRDKRVFTISVRLDDVEEYLKLLRLLYEMERICVVLEEVSLYTSPQKIPPELSALVRYGRHKAISLIFVSRRPAETHRDISAQSDVVVSFAQHEPRDIVYFRALFGKGIAGSVESLRQYQIVAGGNEDKFPKVVRERLRLQNRQLTMRLD